METRASYAVTTTREIESLDVPITHRIIHGTAERMPELDDESVNLVVTSPPYWSIKDYGDDGQIGLKDSLDEYVERLASVWRECWRVLEPGSRLVINNGDQYLQANGEHPYQIVPINARLIESVQTATEGTALFLGNVIWQKVSNTDTSGGAPVMGSYGSPRNGYVNYDYEYISIFKKPGDGSGVEPPLKERDRIETPEWMDLFTGHWSFPGERQTDHPAPFPEELPRRVIRMFSHTGDTVLDPFLGSGTTMKVADDLDRSSVGYEIGFEPPEGGDWKRAITRKVGFDPFSNPAFPIA